MTWYLIKCIEDLFQINVSCFIYKKLTINILANKHISTLANKPIGTFIKIILFNLVFFTFILQLNGLSAQTPALIPYRKGDKWGFVNQDFKIIIPCYYEETKPFLNDLAEVKKNGKWGLIDRKGQSFLPCEYDLIYASHKNGPLVVCLGGDQAGHRGKWGFVKKYEGQVIDLPYDLIRESGIENLLAVKKGNVWGVINLQGQIILPIQYTISEEEEKEAFAEINAQSIDNQAFTYPKLKFIHNTAKVKYNGKWGLLNQYGNPLIPFEYEKLGTLNEGLINAQKGGKWGYLNLSNQTVIPFQWAEAFPFQNEVALVNTSLSALNPDYQVINKSSEIIFKIPTDYKILDPSFSQGLLRVKIKEKYHFLDKKGQLQGEFDFVEKFKGKLCPAVKNGKLGWVNAKMETIIPFEYNTTQNGRPLYQTSGELIALCQNTKWGVRNLKNKVLLNFIYDSVLLPTTQDYQIQPDEALFGVKINDKWGFVNHKQKIIIAPKYDKISPFTDGLAKVRYQGKLGYIDKKGREYWKEE
jgi:hypothetical protein